MAPENRGQMGRHDNGGSSSDPKQPRRQVAAPSTKGDGFRRIRKFLSEHYWAGIGAIFGTIGAIVGIIAIIIQLVWPTSTASPKTSTIGVQNGGQECQFFGGSKNTCQYFEQPTAQPPPTTPPSNYSGVDANGSTLYLRNLRGEVLRGYKVLPGIVANGSERPKPILNSHDFGYPGDCSYDAYGINLKGLHYAQFKATVSISPLAGVDGTLSTGVGVSVKVEPGNRIYNPISDRNVQPHQPQKFDVPLQGADEIILLTNTDFDNTCLTSASTVLWTDPRLVEVP